MRCERLDAVAADPTWEAESLASIRGVGRVAIEEGPCRGETHVFRPDAETDPGVGDGRGRGIVTNGGISDYIAFQDTEVNGKVVSMTVGRYRQDSVEAGPRLERAGVLKHGEVLG